MDEKNVSADKGIEDGAIYLDDNDPAALIFWAIQTLEHSLCNCMTTVTGTEYERFITSEADNALKQANDALDRASELIKNGDCGNWNGFKIIDGGEGM